MIIFEIPSSHGAGQPVITKVSMKHPDCVTTCWEGNQLWIKQSTSRQALSLSDPLLAMIYQWFAGAQDTSSSTKPKCNRERKEESPPANGHVAESKEKKKTHI